MTFPKNFIWGAAAAAYQLEGAHNADGKGLSVWDVHCTKPGAIENGDTGDIACDHYHRYREDVALMKAIGLRSYRLSISWPRVLPGGTGAVNVAGLDFYDRLIDELLQAGIDPLVTLFHWDYPQALQDRGGWLNRDSAQWFADYAALMADRLSDRVSRWVTLNEPQCFVEFGHRTALNAPGFQFDRPKLLQVIHNVLRSHGKAVMALRAHVKTPSQIGYAPTCDAAFPHSNDPCDIAAARAFILDIPRSESMFTNTWYMDPVYLGEYPAEGVALFGADMPTIQSGDMKEICQPLDFFGVNNYTAREIRSAPDGGYQEVPSAAGAPRTAMNWAITPKGISFTARVFFERYKLPIYITENGCANHDVVSLDGAVHDPQRIDFLTRYLREIESAIESGVDIRGFYQWSIMDNFEWSFGYARRFGLIHVDYTTQKRTLKDSAHWYRDVIESNGVTLREIR